MSRKMKTVLNSIQDKYCDDTDTDPDCGYILFLSNSPQTKKGLFPPIITLCDYQIESVGTTGISPSKICHVSELDLTENLLSDWKEIFKLLQRFRGLHFLNLSNNLLKEPIKPQILDSFSKEAFKLRKLVLNGNRVDWNSACTLTSSMPHLEELHLSTNGLCNMTEEEKFRHSCLKSLYLSRNQEIDDFEGLLKNLDTPELELLSLAECSVTNVPGSEVSNKSNLVTLSLSKTKIEDWNQVDNLRWFPKLTELRIQNCPFSEEFSAKVRRMLLIARLPNIQILNGGDKIPPAERENSERSFIRYYTDKDEKPSRWNELVSIHGRLDPLVNIDLAPDTHVQVKVTFGEAIREEVISLYQTVSQFKQLCSSWFDIPSQNIRLFYFVEAYSEVYGGSEEMRLPQKELYTYRIQNGDSFMVVEKMERLRTNSGRSTSSSSLSPKSSLTKNPLGTHKSVPRSLFGRQLSSSSKSSEEDNF